VCEVIEEDGDVLLIRGALILALMIAVFAAGRPRF
jgi:hypothetical protein